MSHPDGPILVLGIGNVLLRDEGIGVRVVEALDRPGGPALPSGTQVVAGGKPVQREVSPLAAARAPLTAGPGA